MAYNKYVPFNVNYTLLDRKFQQFSDDKKRNIDGKYEYEDAADRIKFGAVKAVRLG